MSNRAQSQSEDCKKTRRLADLHSVGPAAIKDLQSLGIETVDDLLGKNAEKLYATLCKATGTRHDPCVIDVFRAAIEQARDPHLDRRKCDWWYWSKIRKKSLH